MFHSVFATPALLILCWSAASSSSIVWAQRTGEYAADQSSPLTVGGSVQGVYRNTQGSGQVVAIEVNRSEAPASAPWDGRTRYPAPGELLFVHCGANAPAVGQRIEVSLQSRPQGGWEAAGDAWFTTADRGGDSGRRPPSDDDGAVGSEGLGLTFAAARVSGKPALKVTAVDRGGLAGRAGLEVGDVIVGVNGQALASAKQVDDLARAGLVNSLIVVDVNTGRYAQVTIASAPPVTDDPDAPQTPPVRPPRPSLGITAETVTIGQRTALKVGNVQEGSPAAQAGLEPGDILVAANNAPLTSPDQLASVIRKSGAELVLTVRDVRTGRDVEVKVQTGAAAAEKPLPTDLPQRDPLPAAGGMGIVTELTFFDAEAAVKITEVVPGSPAARAGLKPGLIVLDAGGKSVLHPNELRDAERAAQGSLKLIVIDPAVGRKNTVTVNWR